MISACFYIGMLRDKLGRFRKQLVREETISRLVREDDRGGGGGGR